MINRIGQKYKHVLYTKLCSFNKNVYLILNVSPQTQDGLFFSPFEAFEKYLNKSTWHITSL